MKTIKNIKWELLLTIFTLYISCTHMEVMDFWFWASTITAYVSMMSITFKVLYK